MSVRRICVVLALLATACGSSQTAAGERSAADFERDSPSTVTPASTSQPVQTTVNVTEELPATSTTVIEESGCAANQSANIGMTEADGPLVIVGDSLGWEVAAALDPDGAISAEYILFVGARWLEEPAQHRAFADGVAAKLPGIVVVIMGFWDVTGPLGHVEEVTPESAAEISSTTYREELRAFRQNLGDKPVAWLLPPPTRWPHVEDGLQRYSVEVDQLACEMGDAVIDPRAVLGDTWQRDSGSTRIRHNDGVHLCPAGAAAVTTHLLASLGLPEDDVIVPLPAQDRFTHC